MSERDEGHDVRASDVAIIGMAGRFPGAPDVERFWENLRGGVESIARIAPEDLEESPLVPPSLRSRPEFVPAGGILGDGDRFDHAFFGVTPAQARLMDPQVRVFLECAWGALEHAGYDPRPYPGTIALYAGAGLSHHLSALRESMRESPALMLEAQGAAGAESMSLRVAHELDLRGESLSIYTACSTGLVAVHMACQSLLLRQSDMALAGGVSLSLPERTGYLYQEGMVLSPDGHCRAFDERASGTVGGHGAGVVVLKLLEDALRDGDHVHAVIRGSAINNDGADKVGYTAPSVAGQAEVIRRALSYADVDPDTIGYVEAHGTGTPLGDPIEIAALTRVYREHTDRRGYCALGSVKTNVGHLDVAAGVAGLIKAALVLSRGEIPPSLHFERPNPNIDFAASPFFVSSRLAPFPRNGKPRRAAVSSFGIGGTNVHAVLEEPPQLSSDPPRRAAQLIPLSARTPEALDAMTKALAAHLERHPEQALADVAYTLSVGRRAFGWRRSVVAQSREELCQKLRDRPPPAIQAGALARSSAPLSEASRQQARDEAPGVAFLFPGQGSQSAGMGEALYRTEPLFRQRIDEASEVLRPLLGLSLQAVIAPADSRRDEAEPTIARPEVALPAVVAVEVALAELWASWGVRARAFLGHSFGEYAAASLAGVMRFEDALRVAYERGRLVAQTAPGRMLSAALDAEELAPLLQEEGRELSLAAVNARGRSVVSGPVEAVEAFAEVLARRKVATAWLPGKIGFHSALVEPVLGELKAVIGRATLRPPAERYISSRTGTWIRPEEATDPAYWAAQMREPVRFSAGLDTLLGEGCRVFVEVGPDQALSTLSRAHLGERIRALPSLPKRAASGDAHAVILGSLGALWAEGVELDLGALHGGEARRRVPLPSYPFAGTRIPVVVPPSRPAAEATAKADLGRDDTPRSPEAAAERAEADDTGASESSTEERIAALWRELLGVAHVDVHANFLEIGGNSLVAAQALARLRDLFPVEISLGDLFDALTLRELSERIDERLSRAGLTAAPAAPAKAKTAPRAAPPPLVALGPGAPKPLSYVQERVLIVEALEPGTPSLNMNVGLRLAGKLEVPRLREALDALLLRHEALRTVYPRGADGGWTAVVRERQAAPLVIHDLTALKAEERAARGAELELAETEIPFDLQRGPMLRALLLRLGEGEHRLLLSVHHVVSDTASLLILARELTEILGALARGERPALPELPIQVGDHAAWQRRTIADGVFADELAYWRERLAKMPSLNLIPDHAPKKREGLRGGVVRFAWDSSLARGIAELSKRQGTTPFVTVLAAYGLFLGRHALEDEVVVGTPIGNRSRPELAPLVGYIAHSIALSVRLGGEPTFAALVRRVRDSVLEAQANGEVPFEMLAPELGRTRDPNKTRLFDAVIVFHAQAVEKAARTAVEGELFEVTTPTASFGATLGGLTFLLNEVEAGFTGELRYNAELFEPATARRLMDRLTALLTAAMAAPETPIGALSMATEEDRPEMAAAAQAEVDPSAPIAPALRRLLPSGAANGSGANAHGSNGTSALLAVRAGSAAALRPLDFSLFYFAADEEAAGGQKYRLLLDGARRADQLGFAAVWTPERHFHPFGGMYPNPALTNAALAAVTERIGLRAGSVVLPLHHPVRVAEEWSVIDNISGGRVGVAFASGWHVRDFVLAPGQHARRRELMADNLDKVRRLWRGEEVVLSDGVGGEAAVRVYPRPVQPELPVWLTSGGSPDTFRLAGELGVNLLTNLMGQRVDDLANKIAAYRSAWEEHGHGPGRGHVTLMMHAFVGPDIGMVRRTVREPFLAYLRSSISVTEGFAATAGLDTRALSRRDVDQLIEHGFDRYFHTGGLFGTPESCREMVDQVRRVDVDEVACLIDFGVATEMVIEGFDGLAAVMREANEGVVPAGREADHVVWLETNGGVEPTQQGEAEAPRFVVLDRYGQPLPWGIPGELAAAGAAPGARLHRTGRLGYRRRDGELELLGSVPTSWRTPALTTPPTEAKDARAAGQDAARQGPPPIRRVERGRDLPLSYTQQRLWFIDQLAPGNPAYNNATAVTLSGPLDAAAMARSVREVVARHEVMRTAFVTDEAGQPAQRILDAIPFDVPIVEVPGDEATQRAEVARLMTELAAEPFDLARPPLVRAAIYRLGERSHVLALIMHHIISDGWSGGVFSNELSVLYRAFRAGDPSPLPELPIQYADYSVWQRDWFKSDMFGAEIEHWKRALAGFPLVLDVPGDRPRPPMILRGARQPVLIPRPLVDRIAALARANGATPFMVLLAAFGALLQRYSGQERIALGTPTAGRNRPEVEKLLGCFVNTLVIGVDLTGAPSFRELVRRVRRTALAALEHAELPFEELVNALSPARDLSRAPVVQATLVLQNTPAPVNHPDGLELRDLQVETGTAKTDFSLELAEAPEGISGALEYASDVYTEETAARMVDRLIQLLASAVASPDAPVHALSLVDDAERATMAAWNETARDFPADACVHELFEAEARKNPDAIAVEHGDARLTYAELSAESSRLARHLRALGVGPEVCVGLCVERSLEMAVGLLAIVKAGGAYVPLDPAYPKDRLSFMLSDARVPVLLTQARVEPSLPPHSAAILRLDGDARSWAALPDTAPASGVTPANAAYVIYTSGSTGQPKGALITHQALVNHMAWFVRGTGFTSRDRMVQKSPISFDASVTEFWAPWCAGGCLVVAPDGAHRDPQGLGDLVRRARATALVGVPTLLEAMLNAGALAQQESLRLVVAGGEALSSELYRAIARETSAEVWNFYGPTEAAIDVTSWGRREPEGAVVPIGAPQANVRAYVLDGHLNPQPAGIAGELYVAGVQLARGYLGRPDLTAERFVPDPFSGVPDARMYRTGDLARWNGRGELEFLGRVDHQVKVRGFRIELGEIESALAAHPEVRACVVVARDEAPASLPEPSGSPAQGPRGSSTKRLVAYVVPSGGALEPSALRDHLRASLPEHMVPSAFVVLEVLPLLPNGKIDRKALPAPEWKRESAGLTYVAPRTDAERAVAGVWSELLRVPEVGIHDNFFSLGGDSILAIQVVGRMARAGLYVTVRELFERQTVAELAEAAREASTSLAEQGQVMGAAPLTPIQRSLLLRDPAEPHHYNQAFLWEVAPALTPAVVGSALSAVLRQHDALRLRYRRTEAGWTQEHAPEASLPLERIDLSSMDPSQRAASVEQAADALQAGLSLSSGPLARAAWLDLGKAGARLLMVIHHLVVDGVSWRLLHEDLERACSALLSGEKPSLGAKTTSFRAWSEGVSRWVADGGLDGELGYWRAQRDRPAAALPVDRAAPLGTVGESRMVHMELEEAETTALLREVNAAYRTEINDVLLSALAEALCGFCGADALCVGLEGHGREALADGSSPGKPGSSPTAPDLDISRTVGWFTSLFPVWLAVPSGGDPGALLKAVKEQLRSVPRRGVGYGWLRYAHPDASVQASLSVEAPVVFNYLGQLDMSAQGQGLLLPAHEPTGHDVSPRCALRHGLTINGGISQGRLAFSWTYSPAVHDQATVERLALAFKTSLRRLIEHCKSPAAFGYTPSDFPLAQLDQARLDRLFGDERGIEAVYPLTPLQEGMLFHAQKDPSSPTYTVQLALELGGPVNADALEKAWQLVVARHATLRTSFLWEDVPEPLQVVHRGASLRVARHDWSALSEAEAAAKWEAFLADDRHTRFDLTRAPLTRVALVRLPGGRTWMVHTTHHILSDGWSSPLLLGELQAAYSALRAGSAPALRDVVPYERYIRWLARRDKAASERFFNDYLRGIEEPTRLGLSRPEASEASAELEHPDLGVALSEAETEALSSFAKRYGLTINTVLQGALAQVLGRTSGRSDVVFGVTTSGRGAPVAGIERMVGLFINTLPLRARWASSERVVPWLQGLQAEQAELRSHEATPLYEIQRWAGMGGAQALFDTLLIFENYPVGDAAAADAALPIIGFRSFEQTNYPLTIAAFAGQTLELRFSWDPALLRQADVARLWRHLRALLRDAAANPDKRLSELSSLTDAERAELATFNATAVDLPADKCVHELFEAAVEASPNAIAAELAAQKLTYRELNQRANQLAHHLRALGVGPDVRVGLCVPRSLEIAVGLLGILKAGGVYVPLDPTYPQERLAFMLDDANVSLLLTQEHLAASLPARSTPMLFLDTQRERVARESSENPVRAASPQNLAYVIYTSGSTGKPKGVGVEHRSFCNLIEAQRRLYGAGPGDRHLQLSRLGFDVATCEIVLALSSGGTLCLPYGDSLMPGPALLELLRDQAITVAHMTPSALALLPDEPAPELRSLIIGGEPCPAGLKDRWAKGRRFWSAYGPTETTVCATTIECGEGDGPPPLGRPLANTRVYVLDASSQLAPVGAPGELYIAGAGVARGYLGRPGLTAERFVPDPFSGVPGARMYRTGDLARWRDDGKLEFLGRADDQVKIRGFRIELGEIEAALAAHPAVRASAVVAREDEPGDRGTERGVLRDKRLVAYVVPNDGEGSPAALREHLGRSLPEHMIPSAFVLLDALPLSPNGKVDRKALPAPEGSRAAAGASYVAPRTPTEQALVALWEELLGITPVGVTDDFFALGGHSLLAVRLLSAMKSKLGYAPAMASVFQVPTIEGLARLVDGTAERPAPGAELRPAPRAPGAAAYAGLSGTERRVWFIERLYPEARSYQVPQVFRVEGPLDLAALRASLEALAARHELLRTTYPEVDGAPARRVADEARIPMRVEDVRPRPADERDAALAALVAEEVATPFDLERGPLTRVLAVEWSDQSHVVVLNQHHIITDEWSVGVLLRELSALYEAARRGPLPSAPPLSFQYADYARAEQEALDGDGFAASRAYWKAQLAAMPRLDLPILRPSTGQGPGPEARVSFRLPGESVQALRALCRAGGATLFMGWYAALAAVLARYSGQTDFGLGAVIANREVSGTEELLGFFTNTLVLRTDLGGDPSFRELLSRARAIAIEAYRHQSLPFDVAVQDQGVARRVGETPFYDVSFIEVTAAPGRAAGWSPLSGALPEAVTTAKDPLSVAVLYGDGGTDVVFSYDTSRLEPAAVERLLGHLRTLLLDAVAQPDKRLSELRLLTEAELTELASWNATARPYPQDLCVHSMFEQQVARTPNAVAVVFEGEQLTYAELNARANRLAHHLRSIGVTPEARVGICLERSAEMVIAILAVLKAGGAYVPLDPSYPEARLRFMAHDAGLLALITEPALAFDWPAGIHRLELSALEETLAALPNKNAAPIAGPDNLAYVIYTSGSTGKPKGVALRHGAGVAFLSWAAGEFSIDELSGVIASTSISFDVSFFEMFAPLVSGGCMLLVRDTLTLHTLGDSPVPSLLVTVPSAVRALLQTSGLPRSLRGINLAGEAVNQETVDAIYRTSQVEVVRDLYGPTEDTTYSTCARRRLGEPATIGRPIQNGRVYLLGAQLQMVPIGVPGELFLSGAGLARGYLNRPDLTAERFIPDPFGPPGSRMYRTGDECRWRADGNLEFLGRLDHQVKIRGFRIELGEIEAALSAHPAVEQCVVVARTDGPGEARLVAYVVGEARSSIGDLRAHLAATLPDYMVPAAFVALDALPLTPNGKVDRKALPAPEVDRAALSAGYLAPRTRIEAALADILSAVLGVAEVGVHDNFFELGGDSILTIQVVSRAARAGLRLTPRQLFERPTIAALAVVAAPVLERAVSEQGPVQGDAPLTPIQRWFFAQGFKAPHHWNQAVGVTAPVGWSAEVIQSGLRAVVAQHDALRLGFDGARAWHAPLPAAVPVEELDLSALNDRGERDRQMEAAGTRLQASMSLAAPPLVRALRIDRGDEGARLVLAIHHLVVDAVSWRVLLDDLTRACAAIAAGKPVELGPKTAAWKTWAEAQRARAAEGALDAARPFWEAVLAAPVTPLPALSVEPGAAEAGEHCHTQVSLSAERTAALLRQAGKAYRTEINDLLLCALAQALRRWTGGDAVGLMLEGHGREETLLGGLDVSRTVGWFTTMFPVRLALGGIADGDIGGCIQAVKEQLRAVPHKGASYGMLRWLAPGGERLALPERGFDVTFNYLGQVRASQAGMGGSTDPTGTPIAAENRLPSAVTVNGVVVGDALQMRFDWDGRRFAAGSVEAFAEAFIASLEAIIAHCLANQTSSGALLADVDRATPDPLSAEQPGLSCLMPLRPAGAERPLVLLPPLGGTGVGYLALTRALRPTLPVWSFEQSSLAELASPPETIEELSRLWIEELESTLAGAAPYRLGGHSFGGVVAVEMARQLVARGRSVERVFLLDASLPDASDDFDRLRYLEALAHYLGVHDITRSALEEMGIERGLERLASATLEAAGDFAPAATPVNYLRGIFLTAERNRRLMTTWQVRPVEVPITLLRSSTKPEDGADLRWSEVLGRPIEVLPVRGDHASMMEPPFVTSTAQYIEGRLGQ